jgi:hypothetical protein
VNVLKRVRAERGTAAALNCANEMIVAAAAIIARELGPDAARAALEMAALVLPGKRGALRD